MPKSAPKDGSELQEEQVGTLCRDCLQRVQVGFKCKQYREMTENHTFNVDVSATNRCVSTGSQYDICVQNLGQ
jgi:hypothetical protein